MDRECVRKMNPTTETLSPEDRKKAQALLDRVDGLLDTAREKHVSLLRDYTEIGDALLAVRTTRAWLATDAHSWDDYLTTCKNRVGLGRTALYGYVSVVERLLPAVDKKTLIEMGISKAHVLAQHVKISGKKPAAELVEKASNPEVGIEEFKAVVAEAQNVKPPEEKGKWRDLGGAYFSAEEWAEIERAFAEAKIQAEVPQDIPDWLERKLIIQAMAAECLSSWGK